LYIDILTSKFFKKVFGGELFVGSKQLFVSPYCLSIKLFVSKDFGDFCGIVPAIGIEIEYFFCVKVSILKYIKKIIEIYFKKELKDKSRS